MKYLTLLFGILFSLPLIANNVIINGTRFVYPADEKEITVQLKNSGDTPALAQIWLDEGDSRVTPDQITTPFAISPPIVRINSNSGQAIRITMNSSQGLPQDRESLWWLNVLDIPGNEKKASQQQQEEGGSLNMAIRSRFKFFWRPAGLGDRVRAMEKLEVHAQKQRAAIVNPTPFYVTIGGLSRPQGRQLLDDAIMIAPKQSMIVTLNHPLKRGEKVVLEEINDYGGVSEVALITR